MLKASMNKWCYGFFRTKCFVWPFAIDTRKARALYYDFWVFFSVNVLHSAFVLPDAYSYLLSVILHRLIIDLS